MAGAMRKMAVYLGLVEDDQFDDDLYYESDTTTQSARGSESRTQRPEPSRDERYPQRPYESRRDSIRVTEDPEPAAVRPEPATPRNWRVDTVAQEPVGTHPAGTRSRPRTTVRPGAAPKVEPKITTLHPRSYNDARRIGEEYRAGSPVIMNLTDLEDVDAKRIVDFAAGLVFGLRGSIERVTNKVFLLSPANVDVTEEARAQLAQVGLVKH